MLVKKMIAVAVLSLATAGSALAEVVDHDKFSGECFLQFG